MNSKWNLYWNELHYISVYLWYIHFSENFSGSDHLKQIGFV